MNHESGLKTGSLIAFIVIALLNVIWLACGLFQEAVTFLTWLALLEFAVAAFYAIYGYKRPHGNHMRYLLLIYAVIAAAILLISFTGQPTYISALYLINIIIVSYMAGRLDRFVQNIILSTVVLIKNAIVGFYLLNNMVALGQPLSFATVGSCSGCVSVLLIIAASYIIRYREHKEAGLADKQ